jgi:hypothetical protein
MSTNYFDAVEKTDLLGTFMSKLVAEILQEKEIDHDILTDEERQTLGTSISDEWSEGKTSEEISDILIEKFGSE